ncbi:MAG: cbb3-type cytochrome c oxidase subunit I [Verrucomicrobiia bacterium]
MNGSGSPSIAQALSPDKADGESSSPALLAEVDASCRAPLLFLFSSAVIWLLIGTVLALLASFKLHIPELMNESPWLTFGRLRPAHLNTMVYGFASQASLGVTVWLLCRLCRVPLMFPWIVVMGGVLWNIGVTVGVWGILVGDSTSVEWLEMPGYSNPILFASYAMMAVWAVIVFRYRRQRHLYISQYYLLASLFWFPWLFSIAHMMLIAQPARGTVQAAVNWWFAHNVLGLWFTPAGLAAIYYFIPKVIGRPIHSYYLSLLGFWSLAIFYNWNGAHHLVGGPLPAWLVTASIVASVMMVIPVAVTAINHHLTMVGHFHKLKTSPTLRFIVLGAMNYTAVSLQGSASALRSVSRVTHFSHHTIAHAHWGMYAFFTLVMFGAMYYILPRITQREWPSVRLISLHFWTVVGGIMLYVAPLSLGGIFQGWALNNPDIPFLDVVQGTYLWLEWRTVSGVIITIGHLAFAVSFFWIVTRRLRPYRHPVVPIAAPTTVGSSAS